MSEDRLEKALEALKNEPVDPGKMETARAQVRAKLEMDAPSLCREFRRDLSGYLEDTLPVNRRMLLEDHLGRCPGCRTELARLKGEPDIQSIPVRPASRWPRWTAWAAAAAVILGALYLGRGSIDEYLAPNGPIATVVSADGSLYQVPGGVLKPGDTLNPDTVVRTTADSRARLRLGDGSLVDLNESTELSVKGAWSGDSIKLKRGDIIVQAAKQRRGHLRVQTRDALTSVKGTIFAVSSGISGTLVSVVEGSVAVAYSGTDVLLSPGEQESTNPQLVSSVEQAISWSPDADAYIDMLASLVRVQRQIAQLPVPQLPLQSGLLQYMPSNMVVYGAVPNLGENISQSIAIWEAEAAGNPLLNQLWSSPEAQNMKALIDRIQAITPYLGNEIVFGLAANASDGTQVPVILSEVQPAGQSQLDQALRMLNGGVEPVPFAYYLDDSLLLVTGTLPQLDWVTRNLGQGASSPFAAEIAQRYGEGEAWLLGIDVASLPLPAAAAPEDDLRRQVSHIFVGQRNASGVAENELAVLFNGQRTGFFSFVADAGTGGAAEYITADALAAGYITTRQPQQMFEELLAQVSGVDPTALDRLSAAEAGIGIDIANGLAYAIGTEAAFALENVSTSGPVWTMAVMVNDSAALEDSIPKLVDAVNAGLAKSGEARSLTYSSETVNGRTWSTIQPDWEPLSVTWTYDRGYMVASSDRATALRAIATREGGFPLVWSAQFQQQFPTSAGIHPPGFIWLNAKDALKDVAALIGNPTYEELIAERDPILVVFDADAKQIRILSRTSISSVVMDLMVLRGMENTDTAQQTQ